MPRLRRWLQETEALSDSLRAEASTLGGEGAAGHHPFCGARADDLRVSAPAGQHPGIRLNVVGAGANSTPCWTAARSTWRSSFAFRPARQRQKVLAVAHTYLVSAQGMRSPRNPVSALTSSDNCALWHSCAQPLAQCPGRHSPQPGLLCRCSHRGRFADPAERTGGFHPGPLHRAGTLRHCARTPGWPPAG